MVTNIGSGIGNLNSSTGCLYFTNANALEKCMNPSVIPPPQLWVNSKIGLFHLGIATSLGEGKILNSNQLYSA